MKLFLLALLAVAVFAQDPIPGVTMGLGAGYDIKLERNRMPLFQWTYSYGQTWKNPYTGVVYTYPDQMYLTEVPKGKVVKELNTFTDYHVYITSVVSHFGLDIGLSYNNSKLADFSFQQSRGKYSELTKGNVNNFGLENRYNPFYQLDIWPDTEVNAHIKAMIDKLPNTIQTSEDQLKYDQFISACGTHYLLSAQFGGFINFTSIFQSQLYKLHTQDWVANEIKLSLTWQEIHVGIDWGRNKSTDKLDQEYREHSFNETDCVGGQCAYLDMGDYAKWIESVTQYPGMIPGYMIMYPITDLVVGNQVKKATLKNAVIKYIMSNSTV